MVHNVIMTFFVDDETFPPHYARITYLDYENEKILKYSILSRGVAGNSPTPTALN